MTTNTPAPTRTAWYDRIGTTAPVGGVDWFDLVAANHPLTWPVHKEPLDGVLNAMYGAADDQYAIYNNNPMTNEKEILAVTGRQATIAHPETAFELGQDLANITDGEIKLQSYGTMHRNRQWFFTFQRANLRIGDHVINNNITAYGSYDGSLAYTVSHGSVIMVCTNQVSLIRKANELLYKFKHTGNVLNRIEHARQALRVSDLSMAAIQATGDKLVGMPCGPRSFDALLNELFPLGDEVSTKAQNANQAARTSVRRVYEAIDGVDLMLGQQGTAWGAVQAVNTWENWGARVNRTDGMSESDARAMRQFDQLVTGKQPYTDKAVKLLVGV